MSDDTVMLELSKLAGIEDPYSFTPENNFGARGKARLLATKGADTTQLDQETVYRYARSLAERDRPVRIVDLRARAAVPLVTAFKDYPAQLVRVGPACWPEGPSEVDQRPAFSETDLEDHGDLERLEEALAGGAPTLFILAGVIERLVDPRPVLRFLRRALRWHPSNRLLLSTPDRARVDGRDGERVPDDPTRYREWTLNELGLALRGAGFEVGGIGWIPQGGWVPQDRRKGSERTVLAELSCDEASYRAFLVRNGLPARSDHLVLTTEHADASSAGGIGRYHRHVDRVLEAPRLLLFAGASGLPEGWRSFIRQRGWLHVAEFRGRGSAGLSGIAAVDAQEVLRAVTHLVFLYDGIRLVEYQDFLGIGHRIAQAKRARLLPPTVTVLAYAHGTHFSLDYAHGALSHERDVEVDARERLSLELADCVWFPSESLECLYVEQQGLRLRRHEVRPCPEITDPEAARGYREALTLLKREIPPPAAPRGQVSVIVPNLNGEARFFQDLRLGLENSSYKPAKVVFVDDGSDERGLEVLREAAASLTDLPCALIRNARNLGLAGARNAGLEVAPTGYVCVHDNDDIILKRYLDLACRILDENPEVAAVTSWYLLFQDGAEWNTYAPRGHRWAIGGDLGFGLRKNIFGSALAVFRTETLRRIGGWDASSKAQWEDWQLYLRLVALGEQVWVIPQEMFVYRVRKDSMSRTYAHFPGQLRLARALHPLPLAHAISLVRAVQTPTKQHAAKISRLERDRMRLMNRIVRLEGEVSRLRKIQGSLFWRASYPLRFLLGRFPASVRRCGRAGLKAIWLFVAARVARFSPRGARRAGDCRSAARPDPSPCASQNSEDPIKVQRASKKVREAHSNRLLLDFAGPMPQVFVAGMARSGTTWVADLINHDGRHRVLFEPFFPKRVKEAAGFEYLQYRPPQSDNAALAAAAKAILSGSFRNPWVDRQNKRIVYFRRLIKDVRCNLMLKWLSGIAPRMRVVLVVRNPFSVVNSWLRLGWGNVPESDRSDVDAILAQPALCAAFPLINEVRAKIDYDDPFQRLILEWAVLHYVPIRQFNRGELYVVHYESLLLHLEDEIERLLTFLDASRMHAVHSYDNRSKNASTTNWLKRDFEGDKRVLISEWKSTFSKEQVRKANEILAAFSLDDIYDGDGIPLKHVWPVSRDVMPRKRYPPIRARRAPVDSVGRRRNSLVERLDAIVRPARRQLDLPDHSTGRPMRPTFLIVGAAKCGTTSLFELLSAHPEIGMSTIKEPNFFSRDPVFQRGWEWYESLFAGQEAKLAVGEASHTYTKIGIYPHAVARIAEHLPEAKLLYIVRHPLVRMESGWAQLVHGRVTRLRQDFNTSLRTVPSIVESSLYWKQISAYRTHYPDERIHTLFLEDLKRDPSGELARCFAFLGVNPDFRVPGAERPRNARAGRTIDEPLGDSRRLLWFSVLRRLAPRSVKSAIRYEIPPAVWDEDTRRWAIERVVDDSLQFLRFYGKPPDFWDFRPVPTGTRLPPEIEVGSS